MAEIDIPTAIQNSLVALNFYAVNVGISTMNLPLHRCWTRGSCKPSWERTRAPIPVCFSTYSVGTHQPAPYLDAPSSSLQLRRALILCIEDDIGFAKSTLLKGLQENDFSVFQSRLMMNGKFHYNDSILKLLDGGSPSRSSFWNGSENYATPNCGFLSGTRRPSWGLQRRCTHIGEEDTLCVKDPARMD